MDEKMTMLEKYGVSVDDLDFSLNDIEIDALEEKLKAFKQEPAAPQDPVPQEFQLNTIDQLREIDSELEKITVATDWDYEIQRYWLVDVQGNEVIVDDFTTGQYYGIPMTVYGDAISLDYDSMKRKKGVYEDFVDETIMTQYSSEKKSMSETLKDQVRFANSKLGKASEDIDAITRERDEYKAKCEQYEKENADREKAAFEASVSDLFEKFDKELAGADAYEELKKDYSGLSLVQIEEKCFALVGQKKFSFAPAPKSKETVKFGLTGTAQASTTDPYGGLFEKYKD